MKYMVQALGSKKNSITPEHVLGVVGGHAVVFGVVLPCQMFSLCHIIIIEQWDSIPIKVSSSLDHYTTDEVHGSSSWFQKI